MRHENVPGFVSKTCILLPGVLDCGYGYSWGRQNREIMAYIQAVLPFPLKT